MNRAIRFALCLIAHWPAASVVLAGGPLSVAGPDGATPVTYPNGGQNIILNFDRGGLGSRTNGQVDAIVNNAIALWNGVGTSSLSLSQGPDLPQNVDVTNYGPFLGDFEDGLNPIIYDANGSITDDLFGIGAKEFILGFAGSAFFSSTATYAEGRAVINGFIPMSDETLTITFAHEMGHFVGFDHSQLDDTQGLAPAGYVLMYPIAVRTQLSLHEDDTAAATALYPTANVGSTYGTLSGVLTRADQSAVLGANLWAREITTGAVYSIVSDYLTQGTGFFRLLLPTGTYTLHVESIEPGFTGGSSVGPYAETPTSPSFQPPHPIPKQPSDPGVVFGEGIPASTPFEFTIAPGCGVDITFQLLEANVDSDPATEYVGGGFVNDNDCNGSGEIGDLVWEDLDGDGIQDAGEPGLPGATVNLKDCGGTALATTTSDASGRYSFAGLAAGSYTVEFVSPAGFAFSPPLQGAKRSRDSNADPATGLSACLSMPTGKVRTGIDAGLQRQTAAGTGQIGDRVWQDLDGNGIQNAGEPGMPDLTVNLQDCDGNVLTTTVTSATGGYTFASLAAGAYKVEFLAPSGSGFSPRRQGTKRGKDSDVFPNTGLTQCISLSEGSNKKGIDAGVIP